MYVVFFFFFLNRIPVMGGKGLDLHLLYVEVTKRGGLEKVLKPIFTSFFFLFSFFS